MNSGKNWSRIADRTLGPGAGEESAKPALVVIIRTARCIVAMLLLSPWSTLYATSFNVIFVATLGDECFE